MTRTQEILPIRTEVSVRGRGAVTEPQRSSAVATVEAACIDEVPVPAPARPRVRINAALELVARTATLALFATSAMLWLKSAMAMHSDTAWIMGITASVLTAVSLHRLFLFFFDADGSNER